MNRIHRGFQLGYTGALILLLGAMLIFFASNWPALGREVKIGCSIALMIGFYAVPLLFRVWLPSWTIVGGTIAFGVSVALLGQIYNSHADSYTLFALWLVPAVLFWLITHYRTYAVLTFVLLQATAFAYASDAWTYDSLTARFALAALNALLFAFAWFGLGGRSVAALSYPAYILMNAMLMGAAVIDWDHPVRSWAINIGYALLIGLGVRLFGRSGEGENRAFWMLSALAGGVYVLVKFVELAMRYWNEAFLLVGLALAAGLTVGAALLVRRLRRTGSERNERWSRYASRVIVAVVTAVAALIGTLCAIGLTILIVGDVHEAVFYTAGLVLAVVSLAVPLRHDVIRYTIWLVGIILAVGVAVFQAHDAPAYAFVLAAGLLVYMWREPVIGAKLLSWAWLNVLAVALLAQWIDSVSILLTVIALVNLGVSMANLLHIWLRRLAWLGGWAALYGVLLEERVINTPYVAYNLLFVVVATAAVLWAHRANDLFRYRTSLAAWVLFFVHVYYDLAWKLLHKSVALAVLGILVLAATIVLQRRAGYTFPAPGRLAGWRWLTVLIVLQLAMLGVQAVKSEMLLARGTEIKLQLAPIDPRSLMQGDYLVLNYEISDLFGRDRDGFIQPSEGKEGVDSDWSSGERIQVALSADETGVYRYAGAYRLEGRLVEREAGAADKPGIVWLTGRTEWGVGRVNYGIENFFVPEGTGLERQENAKYALVRVGRGGDAIIVDVVEK